MPHMNGILMMTAMIMTKGRPCQKEKTENAETYQCEKISKIQDENKRQIITTPQELRKYKRSFR